MSKIARHGFSSIIFMILGAALGFINGILLFPKLVGEEIYGFTQWAISFTGVFLMIGNIGLDRIIIGFYPKLKGIKQQKEFLGAVLFWVISGVFISLSVLILIKSSFLDQIDSETTKSLIQKYFYVLFIYILFHALLTYYLALTEVVQRPRVGVFITEVIQRLVTTILILLYHFDFLSEAQFVTFYLIKTILSILLLILFLRYEVDVKIAFNCKKILKIITSSMWRFGLFTGFSRLGGQLVSTLDIIMLGMLISVDQVGYYFPLVMVSKIILLPHLGMMKIVNPIIAEKWAQNDNVAINKIFRESTLTNTILGILIFTGIIANTDLLFHLLPNEWIVGYTALILICVGRLIHIVNGYNGLVLIYSHKYHYDLYLKLLLLVLTIITNLLFIPQLELTGAALATLITLFLYNIVVTIINWKHFRVHPFQWEFLKIFIIAIMAYLIGMTSDWLVDNIYLAAFIKSVLISFIFFLLVYKFEISSSFNHKFREAIVILKDKIK